MLLGCVVPHTIYSPMTETKNSIFIISLTNIVYLTCILMQAHRESTGTVSPVDGHILDPVAAAEEIAFCRACARFGLGLYLYHEE